MRRASCMRSASCPVRHTDNLTTIFTQFLTFSPKLLYLASLLQMSLSHEGITYKQRAFEILAYETHFYNVLDFTLSLNSVFGQFSLLFSLCDEFNDMSLLVFAGVGAF